MVFKADHSFATKETEVFLPKYQYPHGVNVSVTTGGGSYELEWGAQTLTYTHAEDSLVNHIVVTKVRAPPEAKDPLIGSHHELELEPVSDKQ